LPKEQNSKIKNEVIFDVSIAKSEGKNNNKPTIFYTWFLVCGKDHIEGELYIYTQHFWFIARFL